MKSFLFGSFLFLIFQLNEISAVLSPEVGEKVVTSYNGVHLFGEIESGVDFELVLRSRRSWTDSDREKVFYGVEGTEMLKSKTIISEFKLTIGNKAVYIPSSSYVDLAKVHTLGVFLMKKDNEVYLYLFGGDGAGSYRAKFTIRDWKLIKRLAEDHVGNISTKSFEGYQSESH